MLSTGPLLAGGTSSVDREVLLAESDPGSLQFVARDSAGNLSVAERSIVIDPSPALYEVASVAGPIFDVQEDRILFWQGFGETIVLPGTDTIGYASSRLGIRTRATGADVLIGDVPGKRECCYAHLTPRGAMFPLFSESSPREDVYEWTDDGLEHLGELGPWPSLRTSGDFAAWGEPDTGQLRNVVRYDVGSRQKTVVATLTRASNFDLDVAVNGDVVYVSPESQIFRNRGGRDTQLTNDPALSSLFPRTDGQVVVYGKTTPATFTEWAIAFHDGSAETVLDALRPGVVLPGSDYLVSAGWIAFTRRGTGDTRQVWVRSPSGSLTQLSFFPGRTSIDSLSPKGRVALLFDGRRYLAGPGEAPVDVSSARGKSFWVGESAFVVLGRSLFRVGFPPHLPARPAKRPR